MAIQEITSPPLLDETGQDIATALDSIASAVNSNAGQIDYSNATSHLSATKVQGAIDEVKGITDTISSNLTHIAVLTTPLEINYADSNSIGYRTTETTKVDITQLTGYPTGKTYIGAVAQAIDNWGSIVSVDNEKYLRGARKTSSTITVIVYVFYKD